MITNQFIYDNGIIEDSYPCDMNPYTGSIESNGAVEHIIRYKDRHYTVVTSWDGDIIYNATKKVKGKKLQDIDND